MPPTPGPLGAIERFFVGHRFPALVLGVVALFALAIGTVLLIPAGPDGAGAFAQEFRIWCFGADPATGASSLLMVGITYLEFAGLALMVALVWREPLRAAIDQGPPAFTGVALGVLGVGAVAVLGFVALAKGRPERVDPTVFQAQALRVAVPAPEFELVDHTGQPVRLSGEKGRVVLVTAVYASCGLTCPRILGQARRAVATLDAHEREGLSVLGITLDPEHDTPASLARLAEAQQVQAPLYRLLSGDPVEVNRALDRFDVSRRRDEKTGRIDHANLFLLIDREGRLAYRFTLDPLQEKWLGEALKLLLAEGGPRSALRN